jgi:hypothetical protein
MIPIRDRLASVEDLGRQHSTAIKASVSLALLVMAVLLHHRWLLGDFIIGYDTHHHVRWVQGFSHLLSQGYWMPRWLPEANYGHGSPTFVFYGSLPYYITHIFVTLGFDMPRVFGLLFVFLSFLSGYFVYLIVERRWGVLSGYISAILYFISPYIVYDAYVRVGVASQVAIALFPVCIYVTDRYHDGKGSPLWIALSSLLVSLTHPPSLLLFNLFWWPYAILTALGSQKLKHLLFTPSCILCGWGLASFYLLPALVERQFISTETMESLGGGYETHVVGAAEPAGVMQQLSPMWSVYGVGALVVLLFVLLCHKMLRHPRERWGVGVSVFLLAISLVLVHAVSLPIWQTFSALQSVQFPVRLLSITALFSAISIGMVIGIARRSGMIALTIVLVLVGLLSAGYLKRDKVTIQDQPSINKPRWYGEDRLVDVSEKEAENLRAVRREIEQAVEYPFSQAVLRSPDVEEYRPHELRDGEMVVFTPEPDQPRATIESGTVMVDRWESKARSLTVNTNEATKLTVRIYDYPAWKVRVNNQLVTTERSEQGTLSISVPAGASEVSIRYGWTRAGLIGMILSGLSVVGLAVLIFLDRRKPDSGNTTAFGIAVETKPRHP